MLFLTNRQLKQSSRSKIGRIIKFDLTKNSATNQVYFCVRREKDTYHELGPHEFFETLQKSPYKNILLFIHGENSLPEPDVFPIVEKLQSLFDKYEQNYVQVVPLIWPCDSDHGIVQDYWNDRLSAEISAFSFIRALEHFQGRIFSNRMACLKGIHVLGHDLGCKVFENTVNVWTNNFGIGFFPLLFKNVFLVAGDVRNDIFRQDTVGQHISTSSRNVSIYYSASDMILSGTTPKQSRGSLGGIPLGITGPTYFVDTQSNVFSIDCSDVGTLYDPPLGHTYFLTDGNEDLDLAGVVFDHIFETIRTGRPKTIDGQKLTLSSNI